MSGRIDDRDPAPDYVDGTLTSRHYRAGRGVRGRPYVMVHRGDRAMVVAEAGARFGAEVVCLTGGNHRTDWITTFALREVYDLPGAYVGNPTSRGDVVVGAGAVVGEGSWIVSGVRIGTGAAVLPYSVVTRDVPAGGVVAGAPAGAVDGVAHPAPVAAPGGSMPRGRPLRTRLRSLAARLAPTSVTWNDFPTELSTYPADEFELGFASYDAPRIFGPPDGTHRVVIGSFCSLAWDAEVLVDPTAEPRDLARIGLWGQDREAGPADDPRGRVTVGNDVWVARRAKLLGGVRVGHGAVIATGAVVTDDVRPYAIVAGNPAVEVGRRFTDEQIDGLLDVAWWDWPEDLVVERYRELCDADIDGFLERHGGAGRG